MSEGKINTIALGVSMYFKVEKDLTILQRDGFGTQVACWEPLTYSIYMN